MFAVLGSVFTVLGSTLALFVSKLFTKRVLIRVAIIGIDRLVKWSKPTWDDELWKPLREELEKEL